MDNLEAIGNWIANNESLLSGAAAIIVLSGVMVSAASIVLKGMRANRTFAATREATATQQTEDDSVITIKSLSAPTPNPVHFADSDGLRIAYSIQGSGDHNILMTPGIISHLNMAAHIPPMRDSANAIASFARVIAFDKRGQGLSDPTINQPDLDERVRDIEAVMDDAGLQRVILYGVSEGGAMCLKFAHSHPERVQGLVLLGTTASWVQTESFPIGLPERALDALVSQWTSGTLRKTFFPSISLEQMDEPTYQAFERLIAPRSSLKQLIGYMKEVDVRPLLPDIRCPCLVIHYAGDMAVPIRMGRALAEDLPNAEFLEINAVDHADLSQSPEAIERIRQFVDEVN